MSNPWERRVFRVDANLPAGVREPREVRDMTATRPKPWHRVFRIKEEPRSGELTLAEFAADLHEVTLGEGRRPIYEDPRALLHPDLSHPRPARARPSAVVSLHPPLGERTR